MSGAHGPAPSRRLQEAISRIERNHDRILAICEDLEQLADTLPAIPANSRHFAIAHSLGATLRRANETEEREFLPLLAGILGPEEYARSVESLIEEHRHDEAFADEVAEILMEWAVGERRHDADTVGYMLRGLFDNLRRHIARERDHLVAPLSRATVH